MSGLKKRQTTHHLGWASSRGGRPGVGGKGQSGSARPGGLAATGSAQGRAAWPRASASRRGPAVPGSGERGFTDGGRARGGGGAAAGARPGGGPAGAGLPSRAPLLLEPREGGSRTALETREAAPWSLSRRVPGEASASRPSRASRASYSGDEERSGHPAPIAAAAGRLHCLTITRAGFSPRPANPRDTSLWKIRAPSSRSKKETAGVITCIVIPHKEGLTHLDPRRWLPGRLLSDVQEAGCHSDSARGGSRGPRPAHRIAPVATGDTVQAFPCK
ncbi:zinc finger protein 664 isoform X1 [Hippopotamus amphibius kiboko]|uniref:zinc finger protein 664 isoform X1 n=1 Tax=Hippopotamus amphibius kiboko TaxID=575201 RepID=UPI002598D136|nr:zinc finger protein 664 isoform X1 [Hippopotamus amphibius kiboko]